MKEYLKSLKMTFILAAVLYVALGAALLFQPDLSLTLLCYLLGGILLAYGAVTIISFFLHDSAMGPFRLELLLGIVAAALGVLFLLRPAFILSMTSDILGIYIAIDSLINLKRATELYRLGYSQWWVTLVLSLAGIAMALVILFYPFQTQLLLFRIIGGVFAYTGISDLFALFKVSRLTRELRKRAPIQVDPIDIE